MEQKVEKKITETSVYDKHGRILKSTTIVEFIYTGFAERMGEVNAE